MSALAGRQRRGRAITGADYESGGGDAKFIPVIVHRGDAKYAPYYLKSKTYYHPATGSTNLYYRIIQCPVERPIVNGAIRRPNAAGVSVSESAEGEQSSVYWTVPFERNPDIVVDEERMAKLRALLMEQRIVALTPHGAGRNDGCHGIGKTARAVEYVYRYRDEYEAVFWVDARTEASTARSYAAIARVLQLPEAHAQDQRSTTLAVLDWLFDHTNCLMICDNQDDPDVHRPLIDDLYEGHVLYITQAAKFARTRFQPWMYRDAPESVSRFEISVPGTDDGAEIILRRLQLLPIEQMAEDAGTEDWRAAWAISKELACVPLALELAAASMQAANVGADAYLAGIRRWRADTLGRRIAATPKHEAAIQAAAAYAMETVAAINPIAADLMRLIAFLAPEDAPEELFFLDHGNLHPALTTTVNPSQLETALDLLDSLALIRRNKSEQTFLVHGSIQAVIRNTMHFSAQSAWAMQAALLVNDALPSAEYMHWAQFERILPHALAVIDDIDRYDLALMEIVRLLKQTACYLFQRTQSLDAGPLLLRAMRMQGAMAGREHPYMATVLFRMARTDENERDHAVAEQLLDWSQRISAAALGLPHPHTAAITEDLMKLHARMARSL